MPRGRKPHGRPPYLDAERVTRTMARMIATQSPGQGLWRRSHERKKPFPLFCEALLTERKARQFRELAMVDVEHREVYRCRYGDHYLIESAAPHWHIGRPMC